MSTRWAIARQKGDTWEGRYVHSDGYPSHALRQLFLIRSEGFDGDVDAMLRYYLDDHCGWSWVGPDTKTPAGFVEISNWPSYENQAAYEAFFRQNHCYCHGDRHEDLWDDWRRGNDTDTADLEWAYVLNDIGVSVFKPNVEGTRWEFLALVRWDEELTDERITAVECGENLERCGHYASMHFPEAEGTRYPTDVWLGLVKPDHHHMTHVRRRGQLYKVNGGHMERTYSSQKGYTYTHRWFSYVKDASGWEDEIFTVSIPKRGEPHPAPGVEWVFEGLPQRDTATSV